MDSLPFVVPIAAAVFLANGLWSCVQGYRIRHLQERIELLENAQVSLRTQIVREQLSVPVPVTVAAPAYYPPTTAPPPYRQIPVATAPPNDFPTISFITRA